MQKQKFKTYENKITADVTKICKVLKTFALRTANVLLPICVINPSPDGIERDKTKS